MTAITLYATRSCPFCVAARRLLDERGVSYDEVLIDQQPHRREEMMTRSKRRTVPQIFIGDVHVGGFDDLSAAQQSGELDRLLESAF